MAKKAVEEELEPGECFGNYDATEEACVACIIKESCKQETCAAED